MKIFLRPFIPACLCLFTITSQAQVTKLSGNTALSGFILNNKPFLTSGVDSTLWTTNGSAAGTVKYTNKVKYIVDEGGGVLNGKLYFSGNDGTHGSELWVTDGSDAGTSLVKEIKTGPAGSNPSEFAKLGNQLLFFADNGTTGMELWTTDGSTGGTHLLKDINPNDSSYIENKTNFFLFKKELYFVADDGTHGAELWKTNGTESGTVRIFDINPSGDGFTENYTPFFVYNNLLLFSANDGATGTELWKTDGTPSGTKMVKDIREQSITDSSSNPSNFILFNNKVYFTTNFAGFTFQDSDFWVTDGTANGTMRVNETSGPRLTQLFSSAVINGKLIFTAFNLGSGSMELWVSDGTSAGTKVLLGKSTPFIFTRSSSDENGGIKNEAVYNGKVYFFATDDTNGKQLWSTDGTSAGTKMLTKIYGDGNEIGEEAYPSVYFTKSGIFFTAFKQGVDNKVDIFKTDGTADGTKFITSLDRNPASNTSIPLFYFIYNSQLYFSHDDGDNAEEYADFYKLNETVSPLPVTLLSFSAALQSKSVELNWETATEVNSNYFDVERSTDAVRFESIARINAAGNSSLKRSYTLEDAHALQTNADILYYRLKMVDKDGVYKYSRIADVHLNDVSVDVKLSPNPTRDILTITLNNAGSSKLTLRITDMSGKPVYQANLAGAGNIQKINVNGFASGIYYLQVIGNGQIKTFRFVKE